MEMKDPSIHNTIKDFIVHERIQNTIFSNKTEIELKDYIRGWIIGDFAPSIYRTTKFEILGKNTI